MGLRSLGSPGLDHIEALVVRYSGRRKPASIVTLEESIRIVHVRQLLLQDSSLYVVLDQNFLRAFPTIVDKAVSKDRLFTLLTEFDVRTDILSLADDAILVCETTPRLHYFDGAGGELMRGF